MNPSLKAFSIALILPLILAVSGCGWFQDKLASEPNPYAGMSDEEQLRTRAQARADALIARNMAEVYQYATPSYRASFGQIHHAGQYGGQVQRTRAEVYSIDIDEAGTTAKVKMELWAVTSGSGNQLIDISSYVTGTWVKRDGLWWFVEPR